MQIVTGGVVSVEDGIKKNEEYAPPRKVRVELHFALPEGTTDSQSYLDAVAAQADGKVREMLGQKASAAKPDLRSEGTQPVKQVGETDKDRAAKAAGLPIEGAGEKPKPRGPGRPAKEQEAPKSDPAAIVDEEPKPVEAAEEDFSLPGEEASEPISDDELNTIVGKVNSKLGDPPKIRGVVAQFKPDGWTKQFTLRDIPKVQRAKFKKALVELLPEEQRKGL